jgi:hypothetical protein
MITLAQPAGDDKPGWSPPRTRWARSRIRLRSPDGQSRQAPLASSLLRLWSARDESKRSPVIGWAKAPSRSLWGQARR